MLLFCFVKAADAAFFSFYRGKRKEQQGIVMETIKKNKDFRKIYSSGKSIADSNLVLYFRPSAEQKNRFGISISKKVGGSVVRNKIKRQIKEILRLNNDAFIDGYDIIFVVRVRCNQADYQMIKNSVYYLLKKTNLLKSPASKFL